MPSVNYSRYTKRNASMPAFIAVASLMAIQLYYIALHPTRSSPIDEIVSVILLPFAAISILRFNRAKIVFALFVFFILTEVAGNAIYTYGGVPQPKAAIIDIVLSAKLMVMTLGFSELFRQSKSMESDVWVFFKVIILFGFVNSIFVFRDVFASGGYSIMGHQLDLRGGLYQPEGIQSNKIRSACLELISFAACCFIYRKSYRPIWLAAAVFFALVFFLHQSVKEMVAALVFMIFLIPRGNVRGMRSFLVVTTVGIIAILLLVTPFGAIILDRVLYFAVDDSSEKARTLLLTRGFDIAVDHFPVGTGAGTFGSAPSFQLGYSNVYMDYGFYNVWGASPDTPFFLQDAFIGSLLGQGGFLGLMFYTMYIVALLSPVFSKFNGKRDPELIPGCAIGLIAAFQAFGSAPFTDDFIILVLAFSAGFAIMWRHKRGSVVDPPEFSVLPAGHLRRQFGRVESSVVSDRLQ